MCDCLAQGWERCLPAGREQHHSLKKLFQEAAYPPWERHRIPLIYLGDELAMVAGLWVCEPFQAAPAEAWRRDRLAARRLSENRVPERRRVADRVIELGAPIW